MKLIPFSAVFLASNLAMAAAPIEGWYSSVFGGATWLFDNVHINHQGFFWNEAKYGWGYHLGGRFGYQSNPLRYEGEFTYITAPLKTISALGLEKINVSGNSNASVAMANVYYDFPDMLPAISPFIGLGLGYAFVNSSFYGYAPLFQTQFKTSDSAFAYQGTFGCTYNFAENYALNIAYRYTATTHLSSVGKVYQANLGTVGVIYRFDGNFYK